jgi:hypothetical protein
MTDHSSVTFIFRISLAQGMSQEILKLASLKLKMIERQLRERMKQYHSIADNATI